jgi:glycosyltransferase involved in cell wall biosynthesis
MARTASYIIVTPVRNEQDNLPQTIDSVVAQTVRPNVWIIVDDGSTDRTGSIADNTASKYEWIEVIHRKDRGYPKAGAGVIEAFYDGLNQFSRRNWDFLVKLDGDLVLPPDYFERCFDHFQQDPKLGIAGGLICRRRGENLVAESKGDPSFHVRGATKIYRRQCWHQLGGLVKNPGWDTVDELKANMLGWKTCTIEDLKVHQLKQTGSVDGAWRNAVKNGLANYVASYHPIFMFAKCVKRILDRPYGVTAGGLAWGFASGYLRRVDRIKGAEFIRYVRNQQLRRLTLRSSIWN